LLKAFSTKAIFLEFLYKIKKSVHFAIAIKFNLKHLFDGLKSVDILQHKEKSNFLNKFFFNILCKITTVIISFLYRDRCVTVTPPLQQHYRNICYVDGKGFRIGIWSRYKNERITVFLKNLLEQLFLPKIRILRF
jgi:hypothetical protein